MLTIRSIMSILVVYTKILTIVRILHLMKPSTNMTWGDMHNIKCFTENTKENKSKEARKSPSIILAAIQLMENYIKGIRKLSAFDASSIILSDSNWIRNNNRSDFLDDDGNSIDVKIGTVYYIDYGNTFYDELGYYHHGLCVGKKAGKMLVIPMTSGKRYFSSSYHPINNPHANKKYRQALFPEGFEKDCILKMNDAKFISPGRIDKETISIDNILLKQIQKQLFIVQFPDLYQTFCNSIHKIEKQEKKIEDQKLIISQLKQNNNELRMKLRKYEHNIDTHN